MTSFCALSDEITIENNFDLDGNTLKSGPGFADSLINF